jgi:hypothetical protein
MAQRSKKFTISVLRNNIAFLRANSSAGVTSWIVGATIGVVGNARMSRSTSLVSISLMSRARCRTISMVGALTLRAVEPYPHIRVNVVGAARHQLPMDRECLRGLHAALAVDVGHIGKQCEFFFRQTRTGFAQLIDRSRETLRHSLVEILQRSPLHDADAKPASCAGSSGAKSSAATASALAQASTVRAIGRLIDAV